MQQVHKKRKIAANISTCQDDAQLVFFY